MGDSHASNKAAPKMMLGFIVRRCAADLGHNPTPDEFAAWANGQRQNERRYCLFGKPISPLVAKIMFSQPGRLVTVRPVCQLDSELAITELQILLRNL